MENTKVRNDNICVCCTLLVFGLITGIFTVTNFNVVQAAEKEQIIINPNNIKNLTAYGETTLVEYPENYPPSYLFDGLVNSYSYWTEQGKAGFDLELKEKLNKNLCSIEIGSKEPTNQAFKVFVNGKDAYTGNLNSPIVQLNPVENGQCLTNVTKISMAFYPADSATWTTISEVKLFSTTIDPPPIDPVTNVTKITISNSKVVMDVTNSDVIIKTNDASKIQTAVEPTKQPTTPIGTPLHENSDEEDEDEEDEDDNKKKEDSKN